MRSASTAAVSVTDGSSSGPPRMQPETRARTGRHTIAHHRDVLSHGAGTVWSDADPPILSTRRAVRCLGREAVREGDPVECRLLLACPGAGGRRRGPGTSLSAESADDGNALDLPAQGHVPSDRSVSCEPSHGGQECGWSTFPCAPPRLEPMRPTRSGRVRLWWRRSSPKCSDDPQMGRRTTQSRLRWDGRRRKQQLACAATLRIDTLGDQPVPGQPRRTHVAPLHRGAATRRLSLGR